MTYPDRHADALPTRPGEIRYSPAKSLWFLAWAAAWGIGALFATTPSAVAVWAVSTAVCLCLGHSVGLHRGVIHRAFRMHRPTERFLVWLAVLCGMDGPLSLYTMHELRDGWQNRRACPAYYSYDHGVWTDFCWYVHMSHHPVTPAAWQPDVPADVLNDRFYRWLQRWWRWQQLPVAAVLFAIGGWSWLVWGVAGRITTAIIGHWLVNYFAHTHGELAYALSGGEEGRNNRWFGFVSMGEGWHNNHHTFPRSARIGIEPAQWDPGWWAIVALARLGLAWDILEANEQTRRACAVPMASLQSRQPDTVPAACGQGQNESACGRARADSRWWPCWRRRRRPTRPFSSSTSANRSLSC